MILEKAETDWLASKSIFYNEKTKRIADNINEVIDFRNIEIDADGFNDYLDFGFSVFGHTMVKNVKFLPPCSKISKINDELVIEKMDDPVEKLIHNKSTSQDTLEYMEYLINKEVEKSSSNLILPLSGGFDSRLIAFFCKDKERINAFTYGLSWKTDQSYEVMFAKEVAKNVGIKWQEITLNNFHSYIPEWEKIFGASTHCHGMYQMEFYNHIKNTNLSGMVLSGIIGDVWAGTVEVDNVCDINQLNRLGYTHGMRLDPKNSLLKSNGYYREAFFNENREKLLDKDWNVVFSMRNKIMLLSYLIKVPQLYGFEVSSPFLDLDLAMKMVNLSWKEKHNRKWQCDFLENNDLMFSYVKNQADYSNMLNLRELCNHPLQPLNCSILSEYIKKEYIEWINKTIVKKPLIFNFKGSKIRKAYNLAKIKLDSKILKAYNSYLVLRTVEDLLNQRV